MTPLPYAFSFVRHCDQRAKAERLFVEERRRLKIIPYAFGKKPILKTGARNSRQLRIAHTAQMPIENGDRIMACPIEQIRHFRGEVFVQLEPHLGHSLLG